MRALQCRERIMPQSVAIEAVKDLGCAGRAARSKGVDAFTHMVAPVTSTLRGAPSEVAIGVAEGLKHPPLDAPDGALEHGADLARLQVPQPLPAKPAALLVPGAIESD
jgi:hypothetical protein